VLCTNYTEHREKATMQAGNWTDGRSIIQWVNFPPAESRLRSHFIWTLMTNYSYITRTIIIIIIIFSGTAAQRGLWPPRPQIFLITHNDAPVSRTPLDEWLHNITVTKWQSSLTVWPQHSSHVVRSHDFISLAERTFLFCIGKRGLERVAHSSDRSNAASRNPWQLNSKSKTDNSKEARK
jgi:hypothetical protein